MLHRRPPRQHRTQPASAVGARLLTYATVLGTIGAAVTIGTALTGAPSRPCMERRARDQTFEGEGNGWAATTIVTPKS